MSAFDKMNGIPKIYQAFYSSSGMTFKHILDSKDLKDAMKEAVEKIPQGGCDIVLKDELGLPIADLPHNRKNWRRNFLGGYWN